MKFEHKGENIEISGISKTNLIKSRRTGWRRHVVYTGEIRNTYKILARESEQESQLKKPTFSGKIDLIYWILRKLTVKKLTGIG